MLQFASFAAHDEQTKEESNEKYPTEDNCANRLRWEPRILNLLRKERYVKIKVPEGKDTEAKKGNCHIEENKEFNYYWDK